MTFNSNRVSNANTSTNADYEVANDAIGLGVDAVRYQRIKLVDGTEGSEAPTGTAANPLHVQGSSVGGDVNIAEVGGVAVTDSVPVSLKTPHDGMPLLEVLSSTLVDAGCTTTVINISGSTAALKAGDWILFDSVGALALRQVTRQITSINSATQFSVSPALPATPTAAVDRLSVHRPYIVPTSSGIPSVAIASSVTLSVTNGGLSELAAAIGGIESSTPLITSGIQLAGDDPYAFDGPKVAAPNVISQSPAGTDFGLVVRNIPSGTQAVSGTVTAQAEEHTTTTGTITANGQTVGLTLGRNNNVAFSISGTYGSVAIIFEASLDGVTYGTLQACRWDSNTVETASGTISNTTRFWEASVNGANYFRVRATAYASGTANIRISACVSATEPVPAIASHAVTLSSTTLTAVTPGTGATNLGKATDAVAGATDTGVAALQRRRDTPISGGGVSLNGDYMPLQGNAYGGQWVSYVDDQGNVLQCLKSALAYNAPGLGVRRPADAYIMSSQEGTLVAPHGYYLYATRTTTAGSTTAVIEVTVDPSTVTRRGDKIKIASGTHAEGIYQEGVVSSVSSTSITLQFPISVAPPTTRSIYIYKPLAFICDSAGQQYVNANMTASVGVYPVYSNKFFCDKGELAFGSISGAYATIATTVQQIAVIKVVNGTNVPLMFSFDGGTTDWDMVPAGQSATLAAIQNGGYVDSSVDIQVKDIGSAAGSGSAYYFGYYF